MNYDSQAFSLTTDVRDSSRNKRTRVNVYVRQPNWIISFSLCRRNLRKTFFVVRNTFVLCLCFDTYWCSALNKDGAVSFLRTGSLTSCASRPAAEDPVPRVGVLWAPDAKRSVLVTRTREKGPQAVALIRSKCYLSLPRSWFGIQSATGERSRSLLGGGVGAAYASLRSRALTDVRFLEACVWVGGSFNSLRVENIMSEVRGRENFWLGASSGRMPVRCSAVC